MSGADSDDRPDETSGDGPRSRKMFLTGLALLTAALAASLLLVLQHFDAAALPGCGAESDCTAAAESAWGSLPVVDWPVSFLGFAYFQALWAAWWLGGGSLSRPLRWLVRLGAAGSLLFVAVMFRQGHLCPYCVAVHAGNLLFAGLCEWKWARSVADVADDSTAMRLDPAETSEAQAARQAVPSRSGLPGFVAIFGLTSAVLGGYEWQMQAARAREVQEGLLASLDRVSESIPAQETTDAQPVMTPGRYVQGPADARRTSWSSPTTSVPPADGCTNSSRS